MKYFKIVLCIAAISMAGCTDAQKASVDALGTPGTIKCYSGGVLIYSGTSTGRIATVTNSDGWQLKDAKTSRFVRVSGDCVIEN